MPDGSRRAGRNATAFPGRTIEEIERATFDDGRELVLATVTLSVFDATRQQYVTRREQQVRGLDCGCTIESVNEASQCAVSRAVVCTARHTLTCSFCHRNTWTACCEVVPTEEGHGFACAECAEAYYTGPIKKLLRWIVRAVRS